MHRLTVVILAAVDAAIAVAVGIAATLAPLTLLWVFGFGGSADWASLWPAAATIWQLGHGVPLDLTLAPVYATDVAVDPAAETFVVSVPPLALAAFTAIFAARSGARASRAEAWITGVVTGAAVAGILNVLISLTSATDVARTEQWQAALYPVLWFALPALVGAVVTEWREAGAGAVARLRDDIEGSPHGWGYVPALVARGGAVAVTGLLGLGALVVAVGIFTRGSEVIALFQAGNVDAAGATLLTLAQAAYLPTLAVWGLAFAAGPGFALGAGSSVSPAATQLGVVPGIPILGIVPGSTSPWLLLLALVPVGIGALAGWIARSRLIAFEKDAVARGIGPVLRRADDDDPIAARLAVTAGIALVAGGAWALLAAVASGSIGPGRLAEVGPEPGPVALAVGLEVAVGAGILLLAPRRREQPPQPAHGQMPASASSGRSPWLDPAQPLDQTQPIEPLERPGSFDETQPLEPLGSGEHPSDGAGPRQ